MVRRFQNVISIFAVVSELSHVFCCILPTLFSIVSLLAGLGMIGSMPVGLEFLHDAVHDYEVTIITVSGIIIAIGWALHFYSKKLDCSSEESCQHEPCEPKKGRTKVILMIATILFLVNITIYIGVHRNEFFNDYVESLHHDHEGHEDHNH